MEISDITSTAARMESILQYASERTTALAEKIVATNVRSVIDEGSLETMGTLIDTYV